MKSFHLMNQVITYLKWHIFGSVFDHVMVFSFGESRKATIRKGEMKTKT